MSKQFYDPQYAAWLQQQNQQSKKKKTKKKTKRSTSKVVKNTGCTYIAECDQIVHGRGNIPASCRGVNYSGGK